MTSKIKNLCTMLAVFLLIGCGPDVGQVVLTQPATGSENTGFQTLLNAERSRVGLDAVRPSAKLAAAAQRHANDMSAKGYFSHVSADGRKLSDRVLAQGYRYCWVAENIAQGQNSEAEVVQAWMRSAGHRRNNLSREAVEFGFARAAGNYWVLVLGRPGC